MTASVKKRILVLTSSNLLLQAMGFVYRIALTSRAGTAALGLNSLVMQIYGIVVSLCISGLSIAVTAAAAGAGSAADPKGFIRDLFKKSAVVYSLLWLAAALPIFVLRRRIAANALGEPAAHPVLALMLVCIFMTGLENLLKAIHMGAGRAANCAASELCEQGVRFALVILLLERISVRDMSLTVFLIMLGMTASELVSVGFLSCSFLVCFGKRRGEPSQARREAPGYAAILRVALPASASALTSTAFASAAALLLPGRLAAFGMEREAALSAIGVMNAVAAPISALPMAAISALASVLMPEISARIKSGREVRRTARKALGAAAVFGAAASALIVPAAPSAAQRLFGVTAEAGLFAALGANAAVTYARIVAFAALNGAEKQKLVLAFTLCGEVFRLALMLLLTPVMGVYGYVASSALGELLCAALGAIAVSEL